MVIMETVGYILPCHHNKYRSFMIHHLMRHIVGDIQSCMVTPELVSLKMCCLKVQSTGFIVDLIVGLTDSLQLLRNSEFQNFDISRFTPIFVVIICVNQTFRQKQILRNCFCGLVCHFGASAASVMI